MVAEVKEEGAVPARCRPTVEIRRIYEQAGNSDARRVLVDRLWPRGVRKEDAALDEWAKDVAPTPELRRWYAHEPAKYEEFARRYRAELAQPPAAAAVARLWKVACAQPRVLLTATRESSRSGAGVLRDYLLTYGESLSSRAGRAREQPVSRSPRGGDASDAGRSPG